MIVNISIIEIHANFIHNMFPFQALDRDPPNGLSVWRLDVRATDGYKDGFTKVLVKLKDINDNAPSFRLKFINATIKENIYEGNSGKI